MNLPDIPVRLHAPSLSGGLTGALAELPSLWGLDDVVGWVARSGAAIEGVVVQDELTHDVVVRFEDRHLVFDAT